ncbi:hypothetical protein [Streptomyces sp. NPDC048252]|uniref:hypothetical protein n=1 Tax=Streptomyces sp. NPDC048252 TaxID=3154612 RepID=UPI003434D348
MLTGTVIVVVFQVRASRNIDSPEAGGNAYRRAGVAFLIACSLISLSAGIPAWAAATLLIIAVVIHTVGELWHAAAGFEVSFALAPEHATGQYSGVFGLGAGLAEALGPGLLIALCITWGPPRLVRRRSHVRPDRPGSTTRCPPGTTTPPARSADAA